MSTRTDQANLVLTINGAQAGNTLRDFQQKARDLRRLLEKLPVDSAEFKNVKAELNAIDAKVKDLKGGLNQVRLETGAWGAVMNAAVGVLAALNIDRIIDKFAEWTSELFSVGTALGSMEAKTKTVFGNAEAIVKGFAETNARSLGLAEQQYINLATSAGDLLKPMGFTEEAVANLSVALTDQSGILAEWSGGKVDTQQASEILTKALLGERDALNTLGIDIKDSLIQDELKKKGLQGLTGESKRQAEALITLEQITKQSSSANEAYAKNTDSLARKKATLRARIAEVTESAARGLVPVFTLALNVGLKLVDWGVRFVQILAAIPAFIVENRAAFASLLVALVSLNAQAIVASANTLRLAVAQRAAAIATTAQTVAQRLLNLVMSANPIGLVIAALATLAGVFVTAWQRSETFRRVVTGTFDAVKASIGETLGFFKDLGAGLGNLFTGNFDAAVQSFGNAFNRLNPKELGKKIGFAFNEGYKSVPTPEPEFTADEAAAKGQGSKVGAAMAAGFESQFDNLKKTGTRGADALAKAAKEALELRLKEIEATFLKEELVTDRALFQNEISESDHGKRILLLKQQEYQDQIAAYTRFHQQESKDAMEAQKNLLEIQQQLAPQRVAAVSALPTGGPGPVQSQTAAINKAADVAAADDEIKVTQEKWAYLIDLEQNSELLRLEMQRNAVNERLQMLRNAGLTETQEYERALGEKIKADDEYNKKRQENEQRTAEFKAQVEQASLSASADFFGMLGDLLGQDEKARKKNAAAIKTFQVAQVVIQGITEVQKIWAGAAALGPIAGPIIGAIQTGIAVGRTVLAIGKINATKFAWGGFTGRGFGRPDETGHRPVGVVHENEWVAPKWMVTSPTMAPVISALEGVRQRGYADGGYATTPSASSSSVSIPGTSQDAQMAAAMTTAEIRGLRNDINNWRSTLKADVVYTDVETAGASLNLVRDDASI